MGNKGLNRIVVRTVLLLLLAVAVGNTIYVYRYAPVTQAAREAEVAVGLPSLVLQGGDAPAGVKAKPERLQYDYGTETWHGDAEVTAGADGKYNVTVRSADRNGAVALTAFDAWIRKADGGEETRLELGNEGNGIVNTKVAFPEKGDWILRVRLTAGVNTLEFTERVDVK